MIVILNVKIIAKQKNIFIECVVLKTITWFVKVKNIKKNIKQFKLYQKSFGNKLRGLRTTNPKAYWSLLNRDNNSSKTVQKVALNVFYEHFKDLNNV